MARVLNSAQIIAITTIAKEVLEVKISLPAGFTYLAGQFIQVAIPMSSGEVLRSYSLSSYPGEPELELCVKLLPDGVGSNFFRALKSGDPINFYGSVGRFIVPAEVTTPLVFVATGSGLAPIMGMIQDALLVRQIHEPIQLLFGVRTTEDLFWTEHLENLAQKFPHFTYNITLSQPDPSWTGITGRVTAHLEALHPGAQYFLCGGAEMVAEVKQYLVAKGVLLQTIHLEIF